MKERKNSPANLPPKSSPAVPPAPDKKKKPALSLSIQASVAASAGVSRPLSPALRIGFVPLCDAAPIIMAKELGLYEKYGLRVELSREPGWATIRDKLIYRELDAAHACAPMTLSTTLGLGSIAMPCVTGLVLSLNGNAIVLSTALRRAGVEDGETLRAYLKERSGPPLVLGVPFYYSSHHFLLRLWLKTHRIDLDRDVQIAVVPPPQMTDNLRLGHLDGYCVAGPWPSTAIADGLGWCAALGAEIAPDHPDKILMVREEFADSRAAEHQALILALLEACRICDMPEHRERVFETLAQPRYVNASILALRHSFSGSFDIGKGGSGLPRTALYHFFGRAINEPSGSKAAWLLARLNQISARPHLPGISTQCFRGDIYHEALGALPKELKTELAV
ncbi:NitT/TauT family transport system ATP-binding protein [Verrucomicrobium sp. GAS474]|uniref:CmpA/NrtA family ABC transporter substrate-binding protein n=1 Tax=Verrucomicrobium sp. GAS474 TaxID=1882831 RepID=UPI00087DBF63|nr:CmpA/NrtA family ABC transporter substrate-binding protein [Verrucomicrobium sp. GAS474]SDT95389.1 NitT/TauT family transport system ATP-binding protein [Verrucomicrobium sp. GAS474]